MTDYRALCAEFYQEFASLYSDMSARIDFNNVYMERMDNLLDRAATALAQPEPVAPTDEELIGPIMWMLDDYVYDNDKGEIAQSLRRLIARWGNQ